MTPAKARAEIRRAGVMRRVMFSPHARQRMAQRFVRPDDVYNAMEHHASCKAGDEPGRWKVVGPDIDGDELTLIVVIEADVVVVTLF
jgi:hypothetical protein